MLETLTTITALLIAARKLFTEIDKWDETFGGSEDDLYDYPPLTVEIDGKRYGT